MKPNMKKIIFLIIIFLSSVLFGPKGNYSVYLVNFDINKNEHLVIILILIFYN